MTEAPKAAEVAPAPAAAPAPAPAPVPFAHDTWLYDKNGVGTLFLAGEGRPDPALKLTDTRPEPKA